MNSVSQRSVQLRGKKLTHLILPIENLFFTQGLNCVIRINGLTGTPENLILNKPALNGLASILTW